MSTAGEAQGGEHGVDEHHDRVGTLRSLLDDDEVSGESKAIVERLIEAEEADQ